MPKKIFSEEVFSVKTVKMSWIILFVTCRERDRSPNRDFQRKVKLKDRKNQELLCERSELFLIFVCLSLYLTPSKLDIFCILPLLDWTFLVFSLYDWNFNYVTLIDLTFLSILPLLDLVFLVFYPFLIGHF